MSGPTRRWPRTLLHESLQVPPDAMTVGDLFVDLENVDLDTPIHIEGFGFLKRGRAELCKTLDDHAEPVLRLYPWEDE